MRAQRYGDVYFKFDFSRIDLRGTVLVGKFIDCDFSENDVTDAQLFGVFTDCRFNATVRRAVRGQRFYDCEEV